ncbi:MAG: hypothetical protein MUC72_10720 [Acidobacteria bacterium]|jgi:hypothetical protein|nr:hypothetical protein [Acidobacteriota bacterium]
MKNEELDRFIVSALECAQAEIPVVLRDKTRQRVTQAAPRQRPHAWKQVAFWGPLLAAAALIVAFSLPLLYPPRAEEKKITQIRTEFSLPDKNIKIIWVQRDDFRLAGMEG